MHPPDLPYLFELLFDARKISRRQVFELYMGLKIWVELTRPPTPGKLEGVGGRLNSTQVLKGQKPRLRFRYFFPWFFVVFSRLQAVFFLANKIFFISRKVNVKIKQNFTIQVKENCFKIVLESFVPALWAVNWKLKIYISTCEVWSLWFPFVCVKLQNIVTHCCW